MAFGPLQTEITNDYGTAVLVSGVVTALIPGTAAENLGKAEDAIHATGDVGVMGLAVRSDTQTALAGTTGDYIPPTTDAKGGLWVTGSKAEGITHLTGDRGVFCLVIRSDAPAPTSSAGGYQGLISDSTGLLWTRVANSAGASAVNIQDGGNSITVDLASITSSVVPGTAATHLGKARDAVAGATDTGVAALGVRRDTASSPVGADGDYQPSTFDANGKQWVNAEITSAIPAGTNNIGDVDVLSLIPGTGATSLGKAEDALHSSGDVGVSILAVRRDEYNTTADHSGNGDYTAPTLDRGGRLYVIPGALRDERSGGAFGMSSSPATADFATLDYKNWPYTTFAVRFEGTYSGPTIQFLVSYDGGTLFLPTLAHKLNEVKLTLSATLNDNETAIYLVYAPGATHFRVSQTGLTSGTLAGSIYGIMGADPTYLVTRESVASSPTVSGVYASVNENKLLMGANGTARGRMVFNHAASSLYLKYGSTATESDYTLEIPSKSYFEFPSPVYTGRVDGRWVTTSGWAQVTQVID